MIYWIPFIDLDNMMLWSSSYILVSSLDVGNHLRPGTIVLFLRDIQRIITAQRGLKRPVLMKARLGTRSAFW